jgi:hypothetical protein
VLIYAYDSPVLPPGSCPRCEEKKIMCVQAAGA